MALQTISGSRRKVSMVVIGIDDFSNKIVQDNSLQVWIPHHTPPIWKTAGYYVFLNAPTEIVTVRLYSPIFHSVEIQADLRVQTKEPLILSVRLYPNETYPFPKGITLVEGKAPAGSLVQVLGGNYPSVKLVEDYKKDKDDRKIRLFQPEGLCLDEKCFEIFSKDGTDTQQFFIKQQIEEEMFGYLLKAPLQKDYPKGLTAIRPVAQTYANATGQYLVPVYCKEGQEICCQCIYEKNTTKKSSIVIGKRVLIDFEQ